METTRRGSVVGVMRLTDGPGCSFCDPALIVSPRAPLQPPGPAGGGGHQARGPLTPGPPLPGQLPMLAPKKAPLKTAGFFPRFFRETILSRLDSHGFFKTVRTFFHVQIVN